MSRHFDIEEDLKGKTQSCNCSMVNQYQFIHINLFFLVHCVSFQVEIIIEFILYSVFRKYQQTKNIVL